MGRIVRRGGTLTLNGASIDNISEWSVDITGKADEVANFSDAFKKRIHVNSGWTASIKGEIAEAGRTAGSIAVGSWAGLEVIEYTFSAECKIDDVTGQADDWQVFQCVDGDASFTADKWVESSTYEVFLDLLATQSSTPYALVAFSSPFGSGTGVIDKATVTNPSGPTKEKIDVKIGGGTLTSTDTFISYINTALTAILSGGVATPIALVTPAGGGNCFVKKVEYKAPAGKVTFSIELQGTGAFS